MPPQKPSKMTPVPSAWDMQHMISGKDLGLGMVVYVAASQSLQASRITWHHHEHFEIVMVLKGSAGWEFSDGHHVHLVGDEFKVVPPGLIHRGLHDVRNPSTVCVVAFHPEAAAKGRSLFTAKETAWLAAQFRHEMPVAHPMSPELRRSAQMLHRAIFQGARAEKSPEGGATLRLLVSSVVLEAAKQGVIGHRDPDVHVVAAAIALMQERFASPLQMSDLAQRAACSRTRLFTAFKNQTGMSPNDWLQRYRVQQAEALLGNTARTVEDIGLSVGFASSAYFCTVFRKYTGLTPGEYRGRHGESGR